MKARKIRRSIALVKSEKKLTGQSDPGCKLMAGRRVEKKVQGEAAERAQN